MKQTIRTMLERVGQAARPSRSAFTLLELLIAVGALAIVSVGVAAIFEATGRTVQTGRRVSAMASYASLIERQLRQDFSSMTRDGYLIIKNMYATATAASYPVGSPPDPNEGVPLSDADERPRLRRTDEVMFFSKGQFVSVRDLLDGRYIASADAAAIYYGHGQKARAPQAYIPTDRYYEPSVNDSNTDQYARLGYQGTTPAGTTNPNRFASDWVLVRQVTLLRPQQTSTVREPVPRPLGMQSSQLLDSDVQIALQPAASNLFRSLSNVFPAGPTLPADGVRKSFDVNGAGWVHPLRASGLVDIATTDLAEIKAIVTTADVFPGSAGNRFFLPSSNTGNDGSNQGVDGKSRPYGTGTFDNFIIDRQHAWMDDGLPAWSDAGPPSGPIAQRARVRCESAPTNYVGVLSNAASYPTREEEASRRADQVMLSASNFLPRCSEFIVEWSFGTQYTADSTDADYIPEKAGQMVWYGMPRMVNGDMVANTYGVPISIGPLPLHFPYPWNIVEPEPFTRVDGKSGDHPLDYAVVHSSNLNATQDPGIPVTSYFGYTDPTFDPENPTASPGSRAHNGLLDLPGESRTPTIPSVWPRFIRITMSLADPNNPTIEQSFQFVIEVPRAAQ